MTIDTSRGPAKIYQFPVRGRVDAPREETKPATDPRLQRVSFGSCWYHEAAIEESGRTFEH
jgi:hypothetical protein